MNNNDGIRSNDYIRYLPLYNLYEQAKTQEYIFVIRRYHCCKRSKRFFSAECIMSHVYLNNIIERLLSLNSTRTNFFKGKKNTVQIKCNVYNIV